jgi:hypothetical protein
MTVRVVQYVKGYHLCTKCPLGNLPYITVPGPEICHINPYTGFTPGSNLFRRIAAKWLVLFGGRCRD